MFFDLPPPDPSFEISVASRGYSKGVAQTEGIQVLLRPEVSFGALRVGAYGKNIDSPDLDGETGGSISFRKEIQKVELSTSATVKHSIAARPGVDDVALELNAGAAYALGKFKPRVSLTYSPNDLGGTGRTYWWEAGSSYQFDKNTAASIGIGIRERTGGSDYTSFNAAITRTFGKIFTGELRLYDTSRHELGVNYERRAVVLVRTRI